MGHHDVVVLDPGPDVDSHVRAVASAVASAARVTLLLTHHHGDHAGAAPALAERLGAEVVGPPGPGVHRVVADGETVATDAGDLVAVHTPGHTPEHLCFHWPARGALFAGDMLLGRGDTTWVAEYEGCVADYLDSIARLRALDLAVIHPAHGPPLRDPAEALDRFEGHRRARIRQVAEALERHPRATERDLLEVVYGSALPSGMEGAALRSLGALVEHVRRLYPRKTPHP